MKKMTLRMRLTLTTILILVLICAAITLASIFNSRLLMQPFISVSSISSAERASTFYIEENSYTDTFNTDELESTTQLVPFGANDAVLGISANPIYMDDTYAVLNRNELGSSIMFATKTFDWYSILFMIAIVIVGGIVVYFVLGRSLKPARELSETISGISEKKLSKRIETRGSGDEIDSIANSFNTMIERLDKAFSSQKQFSTAAAHELKTPIAVINANIDVLRMDENPSLEEYDETIEIIASQSKRMSQLIDDLFAMSSLKEYPINEVSDVDSLIDKALEDLAPQIEAQRLTIENPTSDIEIRCNPLMMERVFLNLLENATKYNKPDGKICIKKEKSEDQFILSVSDAGIGVDEDKLPMLFDAFYRVDDSRSRKTAGAGLGLAIVKEIVERHGGEITAKNNPEGGMTFTVKLPT